MAQRDGQTVALSSDQMALDQMVLPLAWPPAPALDDFLLSPASEAAATLVLNPDLWHAPAALLVGPRKSGRSLLGRIFVAQTGGLLVDDADRSDEVALVHRWNRALTGAEAPTLFVANAAPPEWAPQLPDLRSRIGAVPIARLFPPDSELTQGLLGYLLERRGHPRAREVAAWLTPRIARSHISVLKVADTLDMLALAKRRPVTVALAKALLDIMGGSE